MDFDEISPDRQDKPKLNGAFLEIPGSLLTRLTSEAFSRLAFTFTREHLENLAAVVTAESSSYNDKLTASLLLRNAVIASEGILPLCQDTGTAQIFGWKDEGIITDGDEIQALTSGIENTYTTKNLRYSTVIPDSLFEEHDPGNNLPGQILITASQNRNESGPVFRFLFCAKGGGSSNKTALFQETKGILNEKSFTGFLEKNIAGLGTSACPPYTIAVVIGGISPEQNLLALKLATAGWFSERRPGYDYRVMGTEPLRFPDWEKKVVEIAAKTGFGAQFGGQAMALSAQVLRLPRHGASCPVSIGVSCSAHRNICGYIDKTGAWIEKTEPNPLSVPGLAEAAAFSQQQNTGPVHIEVENDIQKTRKNLSAIKPGTPVILSGKILVARDAAHARWRNLLEQGQPLPGYTAKYPIIYAGPAETPEHHIIGSFGPTTAGRMDAYAEELMERGAALITLAKGNRSETWRRTCEKYGAVYLGVIGGAAALIADSYITGNELIDYPDLGMEAVRLITVKELPAFVLINGSGQDFYEELVQAAKKT
ncbi:fumarate hydratase [Brucepastera parasyntrophica]|uniref:fumarate hydratase C-terminal domain-containing protein n=1 Tax=Brucepastera parasyntrophica TaxID=2880008 RepID=UPI00210B9FF3|nr:fumarate hydratase C-terminal domain-containing protein [Brucepastera parasyntrophica]ULQ59701.1 fumarate hydratase [Brucepastera parasyntrophica]